MSQKNVDTGRAGHYVLKWILLGHFQRSIMQQQRYRVCSPLVVYTVYSWSKQGWNLMSKIINQVVPVSTKTTFNIFWGFFVSVFQNIRVRVKSIWRNSAGEDGGVAYCCIYNCSLPMLVYNQVMNDRRSRTKGEHWTCCTACWGQMLL